MNLVEIGNGLGNLHNTGYAHGHPRFATLEAFHKQLKKLLDENKSITSLLTFTNSQQEVERKYFNDLGFSWQSYRQVRMHYIDVKNIGGITDEEKAAREEERKKKKAERLKKLQKKRASYKYNKDGRRLNADGTISRRPGELFIGDKLRHLYHHKVVTVNSIQRQCNGPHDYSLINGVEYNPYNWDDDGRWVPGWYVIVERAK